MNRTFIFFSLMTLLSLNAYSGVKVTSVDLRTSGATGYVNVTLEGRSPELPDVKVYGKTIEITLSQADVFNSIFKNMSGAQLSANILNGKAIIKAILPYEVKSDKVDLRLKDQSIEVIFPRGIIARNDTDRPIPTEKPQVPKVRENRILAKVENKIIKEKLNEDYLNNLMKEDTAKVARRDTDIPPKTDKTKNDEVKLKQSSILKNGETNQSKSSGSDGFSLAGYAAKFTVFLAMVLGLFYGIVQLLKKGVFSRGKLGFLSNSQMIQVLSTTYIAPKRALMVVKVHNQIFLISNSDTGIQLLSEMTDTAGLIKEGEKFVTGSNFDSNLSSADSVTNETAFKIKEDINKSSSLPEEKGIASLSAKDIVKFSDELKKKVKKLRPIEFN